MQMRNELSQSLHWRYGTKLFDSGREINAADWELLKETLRLSPSSFGLQPWRFIEIQSPRTRSRLGEKAPLNKGKIESCSKLLILTALRSIRPEYVSAYIREVIEQRSLSEAALAAFKEMVLHKTQSMPGIQQAVWSARQSYVALGFVLLASALLKIDACAMEGIDPAAFDEILELQDSDYQTVAAIVFGYRHAQDHFQHYAKVRKNLEEIWFVR